MPLFRRRPLLILVAAGVITLGVAACDGVQPVGEYPNRTRGDSTPYVKRESIFGESGVSIGSGDTNTPDQNTGGGVGVNGYLWRATLDTVSFMPVSSADPFGGVIITDWYAMPDVPQERFKLNVYILGRALRADGVRVAVFRQVQGGGGGWQDASVPDDTNTRIEDAILSRARQLRFDELK